MWKKIFRKKRPWKVHLLYLALIAFVTAPVTVYLISRYSIAIDSQNQSSIPGTRIYLIDSWDKVPVRGKTVAFMPPGHDGRWKVVYNKKSDTFIARGFIKVVRGLPGDVYSVSNDATRVNGEVVTDGLKKPQLYRTGIVSENRIFVTGTVNESYDSRYFGTVGEDKIIGRAYPIW